MLYQFGWTLFPMNHGYASAQMSGTLVWSQALQPLPFQSLRLHVGIMHMRPHHFTSYQTPSVADMHPCHSTSNTRTHNF